MRISRRLPFNFSSPYTKFKYSTSADLIPKDSDDIPVKLATGAELEFLGTSSACSTSTRNVSSLVFHYPGGIWMFDCGEGTVRQIINSSVKIGRLDSVFITHLHGDHFYGLPGLGMRLIGQRSVPTKLFSPYGLRSFMGTSITTNGSFLLNELIPPMSKKSLQYAINPCVIDKDSGMYSLLKNELFSVSAIPIKHSVFCVGYVIQEAPQRGRIDAERLTNEFGIPPGKIYKDLIAGKSVQAPDGRIVSPEMVVGVPRRPRKIVILGDTCDPSAIIDHAMDADVLVHEATCFDEDFQLALNKGHSTAGMAGDFAKKIRAKHLILNHFSPRGFHPNEYEETKNIRLLLQQARDKFGSEFVYAARDFWRFPVPLPEQ